MIQSLTCGLVVYDEVSEIQNLVPKLKMELKDYDIQWIFVLNHEQSEIRKWISNWIYSQIPEAYCLENPSNNLGFARQLIIEKSINEYIYLTDPDIDLIFGNVKKLIQVANAEISNDTNLNYAGFGGTVTHKSNNTFLQKTFDFMSIIAKIAPFSFQIQNHSHLVTVDHMPTCHILLNRSIALKIGGFSSLLNKCGEDLDFTHRAYNNNYRFIFLPSAQVIHWQNLSLSKWLRKMFTMGRIQIPVQRMNYKQGLRFYRLLPVIVFTFITVYVVFNYYFLLNLALILLVSAFFNIGIIGFLATFISYAGGELYECIAQLFAYKNAEKSQEVALNLQSQYYESSKNN